MVHLKDIQTYIFLFVNPLSGDQKGEELTELKIQHFRLKEDQSVQVQIYSIIKEDCKQEGIDYLKQLLKVRKEGDHNFVVQVWSGGGDGTIIGIVEDLCKNEIDLNQLVFSCLPFGTGNDFSQALGWGKTIEEDNLVGSDLSSLSDLILERVREDSSNQITLDLWNTEVKVAEGGYIEKVVKSGKESEKMQQFDRNFVVYFALGVQGFVGSGFEKNRKKSRFYNFFVYFFESLKWVAFRKFPSITNILKSITINDKEVLVCEDNKNNTPVLKKDMIEIIIQNIPRVWSMDIDLWKDAENSKDKARVIQNPSGPVDSNNWSNQTCSDNKIEVMAIRSMRHYIKLVSNKSKEKVMRLGQFENEVVFNFHDPCDAKMPERNSFRKFFRKDVFSKEEWLTYCMIDGEFYKLFKPLEIKFKPFIKLNIIGSTYEKSRVVRDGLNKSKR
ncbi:hypothetical protein K502DRAFT_322509 [Neoconidiobolus thromboides FSU 785]|nr:hypothetical protein K502DRAFT_322509 [Neoconidiobolus thromboides FSU 785]